MPFARHFTACLVSLFALASAHLSSAGIIDHYAGGGRYVDVPALEMAAGSITEVVVASDGSVYFAVQVVPVVYRLDPTTATVSEVAGNGLYGSSGDGGLATEARLVGVTGLAVDANGNLYISDGSRIRRVDARGIISTYAGNGSAGMSGDGGPAIDASLNGVSGIALDSAGNLYLADTLNNRVRRVDTNGVITTIAGLGLPLFSGDGGPAVDAELNQPNDVAVDAAGNIYISDAQNYRVRIISGPGRGPARMAGVISTLAGDGTSFFSGDGGPAPSAGLPFPEGIDVDAAGNVYIASGLRVRLVAGNVIVTVAGGENGALGDGGPATLARVIPRDVAVDAGGEFYIADLGSDRLRKVTAAASSRMPGTISTVAGNGTLSYSGDDGPATDARFFAPQNGGLATDNAGNLYLTDQTSFRVRRVDASGVISTFAGTGDLGLFGDGDGGPATSAPVNGPVGVATDDAGNVYIVDNTDNVIRRVDAGGIITRYAGSGLRQFVGDGGPATGAGFDSLSAIDADAEGNLYIGDAGHVRVRRVDANGIISTFAGNGVFGFAGDGGPATSASLSTIIGVAVDGAGNLYIADYDNRRIRRVDASGTITTFAGNGTDAASGDGGPAALAGIGSPLDIDVDAAGNVYIISDTNNVVRRIDTDGMITTVAGNGTAQYSGDGGPAILAGLPAVSALAVDAQGSILIGDRLHGRVRRVVNGDATDTDGDAWPDSLDNCTQAPNPDQRDADGDGFGNRCDADLNNDCIVNVIDLGLLRGAFFTTDANADLNADGIVNVVDLGLLRSMFFMPPGPTAIDDNVCAPPVEPLDVTVAYQISGGPGAYQYDFRIQNDSGDPIDVYSFSMDVPGLSYVSAPLGWGQGFFAPIQWCTDADCFDSSGGVMPGQNLAGFTVFDSAGSPASQIDYAIAIVGPTVPSLGLPGTSGNSAPVTGVALPEP